MASPAQPSSPTRQKKLREIESKDHCPVVGTCLSMDQLAVAARRADELDGGLGAPADRMGALRLEHDQLAREHDALERVLLAPVVR